MFESPVILSISPNQRQALYFVRSNKCQQIFYLANINSNEVITLEPLRNNPGASIKYCLFMDDENIFITYTICGGSYHQIHSLSALKLKKTPLRTFFINTQGKITDDFCRVLLFRNKGVYQLQGFNDPTPKIIHFLKYHTEIFASVATQDYLYVVTSSYQRMADGTERFDAHIIELKTGIIVSTQQLANADPFNYYVCFNAKATHLLLITQFDLHIYSTDQFTLPLQLDLKKLGFFNIKILEACLNYEGTALAILYQSASDNELRIYYLDIEKRQGEHLFSFREKEGALAFAGDKLIVCTDKGIVHKRDLPIYSPYTPTKKKFFFW